MNPCSDMTYKGPSPPLPLSPQAPPSPLSLPYIIVLLGQYKDVSDGPLDPR